MVALNLLLAFVLVLGPTIFVHELGHFLAAKAVGVKVYEFALGFGPAVWKRRRQDTVYSLRILPFGGFVKLAGMDIPEDEDEIIPDEDEGSFNQRASWQRLVDGSCRTHHELYPGCLLFHCTWGWSSSPNSKSQIVEPGSPAAQIGLLPIDVLPEVAERKSPPSGNQQNSCPLPR